VKHSEKDRKDFKIKEYEALWMDEATEAKPELNSFGGTVGLKIADFDTVEEVQDFLLKGISLGDINPDIWLEMLAV